ncbi:GNAT family N-acetyltransferase [Pantoea phytobeneficialis]|uniref:GNAT family N-acetyltransferase n=1 Tax=Pantoea phytobeneficialis TaxID=2052056 RepID=A0AAP9KPV0_9GAMM|nr:GNAT family N-acetyltransferase [Pantoea phytobeneficialis]MDO6407541.1 GNAT family N-acetyltransferase [Pantoea phytobeneficialis]QGR07330.1 ribosomal-protein-serine acetyltransferase [Pantoea phytobeneficialis]
MSIRHVGLRPFHLQDAASFAQAVNESLTSLTPWMAWAHDNYCSDEASSWINFTHIQRVKGEAEEFAIVDENDQLLGGAGIRFAQQPGEFCALGYWVRSTAQRQGVATRAVAQLIALGFQSPEVKLLEILAAADNRASRAVAERSGFSFVDYRYGLIVLESGPVNTAIYHLKRG